MLEAGQTSSAADGEEDEVEEALPLRKFTTKWEDCW